MSTLFKKTYCQQRRSTSTDVAIVVNDDESNDLRLSTSEQESDVVIDVKAVPVSVPTSPVSVTITNDDASDQSSIAPVIVAGMNRKSVRFSDANRALIDPEYSEKVHKYRIDIWYTVRCMTVRLDVYFTLKI
jgi:hypothetical protein